MPLKQEDEMLRKRNNPYKSAAGKLCTSEHLLIRAAHVMVTACHANVIGNSQYSVLLCSSPRFRANRPEEEAEGTIVKEV